MRKFLSVYFLIPLSVLSQSISFDFHSPENIKKFADHLFCEKDYLRALEQYQLLPDQLMNDSIDFKLMIGYSKINLYNESNRIFERINTESKLYPDCYLLSIKNKMLLKPEVLNYPVDNKFSESQLKSFSRLMMISELYSDKPITDEADFIDAFDKDDEQELSFLYEYKFNPPYKSPVTAGIMSAIIPGSGKMYVGEWGDAITALVVTSLFAFLAYDNFKADHNTRAWIFTGLGAFFYAGNIYGSIASAQIFNARIEFEFNNGLKLFLEKKNYFLPEYDFCKQVVND